MWQTKYASAVPKNLGLGLNFGRAVKAISSLDVRSLCMRPLKWSLLTLYKAENPLHIIVMY